MDEFDKYYTAKQRKLNEKARKGLLAALKRYADNCAFQDALGTTSYWIGPKFLSSVVSAVSKNSVRVVKDPGSHAGAYYTGKDLIQMTSYFESGLALDSVYVHESVHCVQDMVGVHFVRPLHEIAAWLAQVMFARQVSGQRPWFPPEHGNSPVYRGANKLADEFESLDTKQRKLQFPLTNGGKALFNALWENTTYKKARATLFAGDGVKKKVAKSGK